MRSILILITLISGLIFTSLIKNKTRLLEKELIYLDNEINSLKSNLAEASLDFQYLSTPKHISFLAKDFLDENFSYYKESQIKKSINPSEKEILINRPSRSAKLRYGIRNNKKYFFTNELSEKFKNYLEIERMESHLWGVF